MDKTREVMKEGDKGWSYILKGDKGQQHVAWYCKGQDNPDKHWIKLMDDNEVEME